MLDAPLKYDWKTGEFWPEEFAVQCFLSILGGKVRQNYNEMPNVQVKYVK